MINIRPFELSDIESVKQLSDNLIGQGYYKVDELKGIYKKSILNGLNCSFVLEINGKIVGMRFTYPPGNWSEGKGKGLTENLWPRKKERTGYFQSLFISPEFTNQGFGKKISLESINVLKKLKAEGIVCHSWKESPGDSSRKYLKALGFKKIAVHEKYWEFVDYICPLGEVPCSCTAEEMYLDLTEK